MKRSFSAKACFCPVCCHICGCDNIELQSNKALPKVPSSTMTNVTIMSLMVIHSVSDIIHESQYTLNII